MFLERLTQGKITFYRYVEHGKKTYFIEKDSSTLQELTAQNYQEVLTSTTHDFNWEAEQISATSFRKNSLTKLLNLYNKEENKAMPYTKWGLTAGFSFTSLVIPENMYNEQFIHISFDPQRVFTFGAFCDVPLFMSNYSFHTGVSLTKNSFSANYESASQSISVDLATTSANIPLLVRYTLPHKKWQPFVNAGGLFTYHLKNEGEIYEEGINIIGDWETFDHSTDALFAKSVLGYGLGCGIQHRLNSLKTISLEYRYTQLPGGENKLQKNMHDLRFSFSFL